MMEAAWQAYMVICPIIGLIALFQRRIKELVFESFAGAMAFVYFVPLSALGFSNPFVSQPGLLDFFSVPLLAAAAAGAALLLLGKKIPGLDGQKA